ncbi:MAG: GTP cyclohydrolase I [Holosporaceae bacterium]|jgi:GTP cyclohydrolase I|nr:GTP cyclohydrolase I [Holosporaceae bacterium]
MEIEKHIQAIIKEIDPSDEEAEKTSKRVAKSYEEFFHGYREEASKVADDAFYKSEMNDLIILKNIPFESHCEHHISPIVGFASIGYIPNDGRIIGASKLARIVDCFARRLQLQERMTIEIVRALESLLKPKGVGAYVEGEHFCISHRGVKKQGAKFVTRYFSGELKGDLRREFLASVLGK